MNVSVGTPSAPTRLMGTPLTTSISLTWSQSSDDIMDSYTISYSVMEVCGKAQSDSKNVTGSPTSYIMSFLDETREYMIIIKAKKYCWILPCK